MQIVEHADTHVEARWELAMSADDVFDSFTDPVRLTAWWSETAAIDARLGGTFELGWPAQGWTLRGRYLDLDRPSVLSFTWAWDHEALPEREVVVSCQGSGTGTTLSIRHSCGSLEEGQSYIDGWSFFISQLSP